MAKFEQKIQAREMRNGGESIGDIAKRVGVGKSTVSLWCQDIFLSEIQKTDLKLKDKGAANRGRLIANENKKLERLERVEMYKMIGIKKVGRISNRELFFVGVALYWAEGDKSRRRVVFVNSDPMMILLWVKWVTKCLEIPIGRLVCRIGVNEIHKDRLIAIQNYWSKLTCIPLSQFTKASLKHTKSHKIYPENDVHYGSLQITIRKGTNLNYEILGYIKGLTSIVEQN